MLDDTEITNPVLGISDIVVEVSELARAQKFYELVLGCERVDDDPTESVTPSASFRMGTSGQMLSLVETALRNDPGQSAAHIAYRVSESTRDAICAKVDADGGTIFDYREDRPSERSANCYICDPAGNRIQLIPVQAGDAEGVLAIDHVALEVRDIEWSHVFYSDWLGLPVAHRVGWKTQDYLDAKAKGDAGLIEAMPGSRYVNERYSQFESERRSIRPNPQLYYSLGGGMSLAVYLSSRHYQVPDDRLSWGTPALGLNLGAVALAKFRAKLEAEDYPFESVNIVSHGQPVEALRLSDPGRNFIELTGPS